MGSKMWTDFMVMNGSVPNDPQSGAFCPGWLRAENLWLNEQNVLTKTLQNLLEDRGGPALQTSPHVVKVVANSFTPCAFDLPSTQKRLNLTT
jgi:hypothetical protein